MHGPKPSSVIRTISFKPRGWSTLQSPHHYYPERLFDGYPALRLVEVECVLAGAELRPRVWHEHAIGRRVCGVPEDGATRRQVTEDCLETRGLERGAIVPTPGAVHGVGDDLIVGVAYSLIMT